MKQNAGTVLIVDDQKHIRESMALMLHNQGYRLEFAATGEDALQKAVRVIPDVILLDIMMPGMDGFEVCHRLRTHPLLSQVPIVMVTALTDRISWLKGIEAGADDFVFKPFDTVELRTRVRNITQLNRYRRLLVERLKFEWVIRHADEGYVMLDQNQAVVYANAKARLYLGLPVAEKKAVLTKEPFLDLARQQYRAEPRDAWLDWPHKPQQNHPVRYLIRPETGSARSFWLRVNCLALPPDMDVAYVVRLRDVTDQMVMQGDIWRFNSVVFHKLRTPLIGLLNGLELLTRQDRRFETQEVSALAQMALTGAQRLKGDLENVLEFVNSPNLAQTGTGFNLAEFEALVTGIATELGLHSVALAGQEQLREVRVALSSQAVYIILWEILENAKKFHPAHKPTVQLFTFRSSEREATMWIGDDGRTLSPEQITQVWTPYYQGERQFTGEVPGMGLGLPMVAAMVWGVGGSCRLYNRTVGKGVVVELILPIQTDEGRPASGEKKQRQRSVRAAPTGGRAGDGPLDRPAATKSIEPARKRA
jgi:two-component system, cell cycle response regulator